MHRITDQLWIGSRVDVEHGHTSRFDAIVGLDPAQSSADNVTCRYHRYEMANGYLDDLDADSSYELFKVATDQVVRYLRQGSDVGVHGRHGESRAAMVCTAALGAVKTVGFETAYQQVAESSQQIDAADGVRLHAKRYIDEALSPQSGERSPS